MTTFSLAAEPSSWRRVSDGLRPGASVALAPGYYQPRRLTVPGVTLRATTMLQASLEDRIEVEAEDVTLHGLRSHGGMVLKAPGTKVIRSVIRDSGQSDCVHFAGANQSLVWCEITNFQAVGISADGGARNPSVHGCLVHGQIAGGKAGTLAMMMIGHSHADSDKPINIRISQTLVYDSRSHDVIEIKSSGAQIDDCTVLGGDLMQRHGIVAMVCRSCWVEGGDIQLNSNSPTAIRCKTVKGILRVVNGTASVEDLLKKTKNQKSLYPYSNNARVHNHDGTVVVGWNAKRPLWTLPALGTEVADCPTVQNPHNVACGKAPSIPADQLPPAPRKLTTADVGPRAS